MKTDPRTPPSVLGQTGATLWRSIQTERKITDSGGLETLLQICVAADRAAECAKRIAKDGLLLTTENGPRENPLLKHELANRAFVVRSLAKLGRIGQPPRRVGNPGYGGIGVTFEDLNDDLIPIKKEI
jgi:hypothetical protein